MIMVVRQQDAYRLSAIPSAIFFLFVLLPGSGLADTGSPEGYWYGKGFQPAAGKTLQWLTSNRSNGSYTVEFREYTNCLLKFSQVEEGRWTVSGNVLTKKVLIIDGQPVPDHPDYTDAYRIVKIDGHKMSYIHQKTGQYWTAERVTKDFTFPDCANVS